MSFDASLLTGASVPTAASGKGGGGPATGDPLVVGKFSGTLVQQPSGPSLTYLSDTGEVGDTTINDGVPQNYPTSARTIEGLRVTSKSGTGGNALVVTLYKNGAPTAMVVTIAGSSPPVTLGADFAHPITFADGDTFDVVASMASGTGDGPYFLSATLEGGAAGGGGGGGGGSIDRITSTDSSVSITSPTGPTVDLSVPLAGPATAGRMSSTQWQQLGLDWWSQRTQRAIMLLNASTVQVDSPKRFDFTQWPPLALGTTPPVPDLTRSGVYIWSGASDGALVYSPATGSILIPEAQTDSFFVSVQVAVDNATLASGEFVLLGLIDLANVGNPAGSSNYIKIGNNTAFGADGHLRLWMDNGALSAPTDLGVIGGPNIPDSAPFTIDLYFDLDAGALVVAIQDVEITRLLPGPSSPLNSLPTVPLQMVTSQNTGSPGIAPRSYGGFAMLNGPTT